VSAQRRTHLRSVLAWLAAAALYFCLCQIVAAQEIKSGTRTTGATQPAEKPVVLQETNGGSRMILALAAVIGLIFILRWGLRSVAGNTASTNGGVMSVIARCGVGPRQQLMLVKLGRRVILVGNGGAQMNALCEINDADEIAQLLGMIGAEKHNGVSQAFSSIFRRETERYEPQPAPPETTEVGLARDEIKDLMNKLRGITKSLST
jgi:flagellar biogenesis protein FliO